MNPLSLVKSLVLALAAAVAALLPFLVLPLFAAMLVSIAIMVAIIFLDARKNRILVTMAKRNILRRPGTTALVIGGLMVGTAIISTSFVVGDTLNNLIVKQASASYGEVDFGVGAQFEGLSYFEASYLDGLAEEIQDIEHVEHANTLIRDRLAVQNQANGLFSSTMAVLGMNDTLVGGFGSFFDVSGSGTLSDAPTGVDAYLNDRAARELDARAGDHLLLLRGGSFLAINITHIVSDQGLGGYNSQAAVYVGQSTLQVFLNRTGQVNFLFISLQGPGDEGLSYAGEVRTSIESLLEPLPPTIGLKILQDKDEAISQAKTFSEMFTSMFFVLGSFTVVAGIALVINIFTMLGEERKSEMGVARAIGLRRSLLRRLFTYEGTIYAAMAAGVGALLGIVLAYAICYFMTEVFRFGDFDLVAYFTFTPFSLAISYLAGFLLTLGTVYMATRRISLLNIVRAVRSVPEPPISRDDKRTFRYGLLLFVGGLAMMLFGIADENLTFAMSGLSFVTLSLGLILRRYISENLAWTLAGLVTLLIWMPLPFDIFPYDADIEMFVVSGLFMVIAALIVVMFNSDALVAIFTRIFRVRKEYRAVIKTAISYPLKAKFRTALSVFIFGLVIFTVTALTMISGILAVNISKQIEETSGGFDVIAFTSLQAPIMDDPWEHLNASASYLQGQNVTELIPMPLTVVQLNMTKVDGDGNTKYLDRIYTAMGFDHRLFTQGSYPLKSWNSSQYSSEREVWEAALDNGSLAIVDGSLAPSELGMTGPPGTTVEGIVEVGDRILVANGADPPRFVTIIGVMKQSSMNGVFLNQSVVRDALGAMGYGLMLVKFKPGLDVQGQAILMEKEFLANGLQTVDVAAIAKLVTSTIDSIFTLFRAFLGMGLIIGISGLGIITIRSIHERRIEIGMMRAIGYRKRMIVANFALESAFISLLGIILGSVLGIIVGYQLWEVSFQSNDFVFVIDWVPILSVGLLAFFATLLSVYPAARGASKVTPADVLRFE